MKAGILSGMEETKTNCYHCDQACDEIVRFDQKTFCCEGCRTVYELLSESGMNRYYALNERPGSTVDQKWRGKYNFLELEDIREKLMQFSSGGIGRVKLALPQIHCSSCLWLLERLHKLHPGVVQCQVFFADKEAEITFRETEISLKELAELLASIGYAPNISLQEYSGEKNKKINHKLLLQIGVTGFCFGNIMLLSFPEYTGIDEQFQHFQRTFNYLNLILSIPVLLFGAKDYILSSFKAIAHKSINIDVPITLGIFALYSRSVFEVLSGNGAGYFDSFAGLIFFLLIGKWFQQKTYSAINFERDYKSYFPIAAAKKTEQGEEIVALKQIHVGDHLIIRNSELIPADAILINGQGRIDYSFVSGESEPITKVSGEKLFAGGRQVGSVLEIEVVKDVENSYLTRLWNNPVFHGERTNKGISDIVSQYFTLAIVLLAVVAGIVWMRIDSSKAAFVVTSVLIVACPCAIALSVPFTYGNVIRRMARKAFFLRSTDVIEPITKITDIVFDKTGTLTETGDSEVCWKGEPLNEGDKSCIRQIVNQSAHPLSRVISRYISGSVADSKKEVEGFMELPGEGLEATVEGVSWRVGSAQWLNAQSGETTTVFVEKEGRLIGSFEFRNRYRNELSKLFGQLSADYQLHILSGDNSRDQNRLEGLVGKDVQMNFNQGPDDKLAYISNLQSEGKSVMMLGDGLNDAGALKQANVGVAVVEDVYAFSPSSDVIIDAKKLVNLPSFIRYAFLGSHVVKWSYLFSLIYNTIGLYFALSGQLTPLIAAILMPLSSISVVLFVTILTNSYARKLS